MKTRFFLIPIISAALVAGCATVPPTELTNARIAYQQASEGEAKQLVPAELHKAKESLNLAEQSFKDDSDSQKTKDLAYVAQRKSEQAVALGAIAASKARKEKAEADYAKKQTAIVKQGKQDLSDAEKQTADARAELDKQAAVQAGKEQAGIDSQKQQAEIEKGRQDLRDSEKRTADVRTELDKQAAVQAGKNQAGADYQRQQDEMRANRERADAESRRQQDEIAKAKQDLSDAEKRNAAALAELAAIAAVKEEQRGLIVTLSGGVLFRSAEATLMPSAQVKLDQVGNALQSVRSRNLIVEGHTDSQGSGSYNQGLSQRRADAVRNYLVRRGYPADRIQARGMGEDTPIANNLSPEGRANNRRVEIVIEREFQVSNP